jgi:hypothetical protein
MINNNTKSFSAGFLQGKKSAGQGTIEYLVIIAIVVVIALVVVGLLLQVMDQGSAVPEQTAKTAWKSAEPFAITDWTLDASEDTLTVVIKNNTFETLGLNSIYINANDKNTQSGNVAPGATVTRIIRSLTASYSAGDKYSYSHENNAIYIDYNTPNITNKKQYGNADIVGTAA